MELKFTLIREMKLTRETRPYYEDSKQSAINITLFKLANGQANANPQDREYYLQWEEGGEAFFEATKQEYNDSIRFKANLILEEELIEKIRLLYNITTIEAREREQSAKNQEYLANDNKYNELLVRTENNTQSTHKLIRALINKYDRRFECYQESTK